MDFYFVVSSNVGFKCIRQSFFFKCGVHSGCDTAMKAEGTALWLLLLAVVQGQKEEGKEIWLFQTSLVDMRL